jgi:hypothetical protein
VDKVAGIFLQKKGIKIPSLGNFPKTVTTEISMT